MEFHEGDLVRVIRDHSGLSASEATLVIEGPHDTYSETGEYMRAHYIVPHIRWGTRSLIVRSTWLKSV